MCNSILICLLVNIVFAIPSVNAEVSFENRTLQYIGCIDGSLFVGQSYYSSTQDLTWEEGVSACNRRLTRFMGVRLFLGLKYFNFFCGNDLQKNRVNVSTCARLKNGQDVYAIGSPNGPSIAVYKLREDTPLAILAATEKGTKLWREDTLNLTSVIDSNTTHDIDFYYTKEELFTLDGLSVFRSSAKSSSLGQKIETETPDGVTDLVFDWVDSVLYWSGSKGPKYPIYGAKIFEEQLNGAEYEVASTRHRIKDLTIDPYSRFLFFVDDEGSLMSFSLKEERFYNYTESPEFPVRKAKHLAVDFRQRLIYVTGWTADHHLCLISKGYDNKSTSKPAVVFKGAQLTNPYSLDVFNNEVVWVDTNNGDHVYKCLLTPTCNEDDLHELFTTSENIYDIKIYHPEKQAPPEWYLCESLRCSHSCARVSLFKAKCSTLIDDQHTLNDASTTSNADETSPTSDLTSKTKPTTPNPQTTTIFPNNSTANLELFSKEIGKSVAMLFKLIFDQKSAKHVIEHNKNNIPTRVLVLEILLSVSFLLTLVLIVVVAYVIFKNRSPSASTESNVNSEMKVIPNVYSFKI